MEVVIDVRPGAHGSCVISARDLSSPGWSFDPLDAEAGTVVVDTRRVAVVDIDSIEVAEHEVRPEWLPWILPRDQAYAAAEMTAMLEAWLVLFQGAVDGRPRHPSPLGPNALPRKGAGARPLLLGSSADAPMLEVCAALYAMGCVPLVLDEAALLAGRAHLGDGGLLKHRGGTIRLGEISSAYLRPGPSLGREQLGILEWADEADAVVVNRPTASSPNNSKPRQLHAIAACGFDVPPTLVTTSPEMARAFAEEHGRIVFKSTSGVRSIATELSDGGRDRLAAVRVCPTMFQRLVVGIDVRVHVVGSAVYAVEIEADTIDYRYSQQLRMSPVTLEAEVADRVVGMVRAMGLHVAGVDFRLTPDGRWVCFEVNPSPGFTYFSSLTKQPVGAAIASLMAAA